MVLKANVPLRKFREIWERAKLGLGHLLAPVSGTDLVLNVQDVVEPVLAFPVIGHETQPVPFPTGLVASTVVVYSPYIHAALFGS